MQFEDLTALAQKMVDVAKQRQDLTTEEKQIVKLLYKSMGGPTKAGRKRKVARKGKKGGSERAKKAWETRRANAEAKAAEAAKVDKKFPKVEKPKKTVIKAKPVDPMSNVVKE